MNWQQIRIQYPALSERAYLNTAACGLVSTSNHQSIQAFWQDLLNHGGLHRMEWEQETERIRAQLAAGIGVSARQFSILPNFTVGLNYAVQLLRPRNTVLLVEGDYNSVTLPWELMGYSCHWVSPEANGAIPLAKLASALKQHQPQILAISHVQWHTGYALPLAELSQLCRDLGVCLVLDTTQSWGMLEMDLRQTPVDVFISSAYKWPTAGFGSAVMYVSEEIWSHGQLPVVGQGSTFLMEAGQKASCQTLPPAGMEAGHRDYASVFALGKGWAELEIIGLKNIENRILELVAYLHQEANRVGWQIISDYAPTYRSGIVQLEGEQSWVQQFAEQEVDISYRQGGIRVSIHFYNDESDIDRLISVYSRQ